MAAIKTLNFLPVIFQSDTNQKFLSATMDQLVSEPNLTTLYGYIGRKFAPTYKTGDSYITEYTSDRQNYQLEPSVVVRDLQNNISFFSSYPDLLNKIKYYGGIVNNHSRLFDSEYYSFDPLISFDKFVNFSQYYWLPNGPDPVMVDTTGIELTKTWVVTRDTTNNQYVFTSEGEVDNSLTFARGGTYTFVVNQPGYPFWIQSQLGTSGVLSATPTISSRDVLGVTNNGTDSGVITFQVPQSTAQDVYLSMPTIYNVDYATPLAYSDLENQFISQFLAAFPQYGGITGTLDGKYLIFANQGLLENQQNIWTAPAVIDPITQATIPGYDAGTVVPDSEQYGIWQVKLVTVPGVTDKLIRLVYIQDVAVNQKVYVRYGLVNANKDFYKDYDGFFHQVPLITASANVLYIQDGINSDINDSIKLVEFSNWSIDVENDILGKLNYTSPNGVQFTTGLKIQFGTDVTPSTYQNNQYYVEEVGSANGIRLVDVNLLVTPEAYHNELALNYPDEIFPDYITINRSSVDLNAWSRNNRWFHRQVITDTAAYNNTVPVFDQSLRATRPIIQFNPDILLLNYGRIGKQPIDILDTTTLDAFTQLQGQPLTEAFGITVTDGLRVLFANDIDPLVKNRIYVVNLVQYQVDENGLPTGTQYIDLTLADDGVASAYDTLVVLQGKYAGSQWWYDGVNWNDSQQKTGLQQPPLFDVFDSTGKSFSTYNRSTFAGTQLFGYLKSSAGVNDPVLGFPLSYRNLTTQGEMEFQTYFSTDTFNYVDSLVTTMDVSSGFLQTIVDANTLEPRNTWQTVVEYTKQYQLIGYIANGINSVFPIDVTPDTQASIPYLKVYHNYTYLEQSQWLYIGNSVRLTIDQTFTGDGVTKTFTVTNGNTVNGVVVIVDNIVQTPLQFGVSGSTILFATAPDAGANIDIRVISVPDEGDKIDILVYSSEVSKIGSYQIPTNLELNAQNTDISTMTLGQIRNHLVALAQNSTTVVGNVLGSSNLRDIEINSQGGTILQNSAPVPHSAIFLLDNTANFIDATRYAQQEYTKFKNKFLNLSASLNGIDPNDPVSSVDLILTTINSIKNKSFPWYYSDMVPYGTLKNTLTYTVFDPLTTDYELTTIFNNQQLSNLAVLVYLNGEQLVVGIDFNFRTDRPSVTFYDIVNQVWLTNFNVGDVITIVEYANTDGAFVPETPTKLGLWPKFIPEMFLDDTYRYVDPTTNIQGINVIRGHDGSITPAFNDYRDSFLLELELRIYNNIKLPDVGTYEDILSVIPGKFRTTDYALAETTQIVSQSFLHWLGNNKLDFSTNETFDSSDAFTWNYSNFVDRINGERLPGSWRACYQYFYDTFRPHLTPWEMLGFTAMPSWWVEFYGPAPYTGGNKLLWDDLEAGMIRFGPRQGIDSNYVRTGLSQIIPVDDNGNLLSPAAILTASFNSIKAGNSWSVGQYGPVEYAWRNSSDFPYAVQLALAVAKPGRFFGLLADTYNYTYNYTIGQYLTSNTNQHLTQFDVDFNGDTTSGTPYRGAGYINWIADYLTSQGINPASYITPLLQNYKVELAYKAGGFTDQKYLQVLAEQVSPASTSNSIVVPNENYSVYLYKSTPIQTLTYSAVIVEKTENGYSIRGYNLNDPYFTIIPSEINSNAVGISVLNNTATVFKDYQNLKLTVPYGYEFTTQQQVVDFLISYERYLIAQGFTFTDSDPQLGEIRNWTLSSKEFLFWTQQGWSNGSIIVLSPVANVLNAISISAITDGIEDSQYGSKVLDQNFGLVKNNNYDVLRSPNTFKLTLNDSASVIGYVEINLVQYEHVLVFDNTTVFNDVIYQPETGNRQYRLKLIGQKTALWNGSLSAPGFIYSSGEIDIWDQGTDYLKGDIVQYKNQYYTALQNIIANPEFQFQFWQQLNRTQIQTGLLPNFATLAVESQSYYDSYGEIKDKDQIEYSHALIGFKPRQYLSDLGLSETTQIEFYKGFIAQKGSANAVNQMLTATFDNLSSEIAFYEEWAMRVGEYGALDSNPYIEIPLDEKAFGVNPSIAQFVAGINNNTGNGITIFNSNQLYKSEGSYTGNIALSRTSHSNYDNDIPTAGYVNINDVDLTIFDLANYQDLDNNISQMGSGYRIWVAKDFTQNWNVYRVTETNNGITTVSNSLNGYVTFTTSSPHQLTLTQVFIVQNFNSAFDGFYQVYKIVDDYNVMVAYSGDTSKLTTLSGSGLLLVLDSLRFTYMEDARIFGLTNPPNGWQVGEKIWIDDDAATTSTQGQPFTTVSGTWKVYEKAHPWTLQQPLTKNTNEYFSNDGFGSSVKMSADNMVIVSGSPTSGNTGIVNTFLKDYQGNYNENLSLIPDAGNVITPTSGFGTTVDLAQDALNNTILAVGAPSSYNNLGYVYIYNKPSAAYKFAKAQVIVGNVASTNDAFGSSIAFNQDGEWMFVGAPNNNKVYAYGLNRFVPVQSTIISVPSSTAALTLPFTPYATNDATSLLITSNSRTFIPNIDYTLSGKIVYFTALLSASDITIVQQPYYSLVTTLTIPTSNVNSQFGYALSSSFDGAQMAVGAPGDTVTDANGINQPGAGSVWVYDRVIEAFNTTGAQVYTTKNTIANIYKVTLDGIEVNDYFVSSANTITFVSPPPVGHILYIEVNQFNLLEQLVGVDSLQGGLQAIQANAAFGTSLTICSNNCAIYVGAPYYSNGLEHNSGAVWKFHNRGRLYGTNTGYQLNPVFTTGDTIRLNNFEVTVANISTPSSNVASLNDLVTNINDADILGISAVNQGGYLRLNSDVTVFKDQLRIVSGVRQPGSPGVYVDADLRVFAFMQIIINPYGMSGEFFGSKVKLASSAYMLVIGSGRGTTKADTTYDVLTTASGTIFDHHSTRWLDAIPSSGSVYIYELYDDPRNVVEHPGRYQFAQQLNPGSLVPGAEFGYALDIEGQYITVTAPGSTVNGEPTGTGTIYVFQNPTLERGWNLIRYQQDKVDVDSISRIYLYNSLSNQILENLQFIDPAKGKILGQAEQEISFKTEYDPAIYNRGSNPAADINTNVYWGTMQVGKVWWNLSQVRYIDYEQDTLTYRSINWGNLFPGSVIEINEWVQSSVLPSKYVANGGDGVPKYADDSAYVEIITVDPITDIIGSVYYFWVTGKTTVDPNNTERSIPTTSIQDIILNPKNQGIAYAAVIQNSAIILYNVGSYLSAKNTILHLDYQLLINTNIIHSEYQLVQKGKPNGIIPDRVVNKLIDSLAGIDNQGAAVPDPGLSLANSYGISIRPRQSMFVDRLTALSELIAYVNSIFVINPITEEFNLTALNDQEPVPNAKLNAYDLSIDTDAELAYINVNGLTPGYVVLVLNDSTQDGLWVLYQLQEDLTWGIYQVQSYKNSLYWSYIDWYATGYSSGTKPTYSVSTQVDALKLSLAIGDIVKVNNSDRGGWILLLVESTAPTFTTVGIQNGTIQLDSSLSDFANNEIGFGNQGFSTNRYDQNPNIEIRSIVTAIKDTIFINQLEGNFNNLFFILINYLLTEQTYVDWLFKSSFISVVHQLRTLSQFPSYTPDNQTYYQDYIDEVKPYRTKVREYLINYSGSDTFNGSITDFDLPSYYDTSTITSIFRSPSGEYPYTAEDEATWQTFPYNQWYQNRTLQVDSILIENPGYGYTTPPSITIVGGGATAGGATANCYIDGNTGEITAINVITPGSGYVTTPTIIINGSANIAATAYATLKNYQVRSFDTTIKFDRITYSSTVQDWQPNTAYTAGTIVSYASSEGNTSIRSAYQVTEDITTGAIFNPLDYTVLSANSFSNANDRIIGYYQPSASMPARDLTQLVPGVDYPGVQVLGADFDLNPNYGSLFGGILDNIDYDDNGSPILSQASLDTIIQSQFTDAALGTRAEDINVDGGAYVDQYASHAPEELVPGIVFDTLDMRIYTKINSGANVIAYRVFNNMLNQTSYLRISTAYTTTLSANLALTDTTISVVNASALTPPSIANNTPGVVFIGGERITYWTIDLVNNVLGQIRRGTQGTAAVSLYTSGTSVIDGGIDQNIVGSSNYSWTPTVNVTDTTTSSNTYTFIANVTYTRNYANVFYNHGISTAIDGTGLTGSTTPAALFLKAYPIS